MRLSPTPIPRPEAIVIPSDVPVYRIKEGKFFGPNDHLFQEGEIIEFSGEPNLEMEPLNELARGKMREFLALLDDEGRKAAEKAGKAYHGYLNAFENSIHLAKQEGKSVRSLTAKEMTPVLGVRKDNSTAKKLEADTSAPMFIEPKATAKEPKEQKKKFSLNKDAIGKAVVNGVSDLVDE